MILAFLYYLLFYFQGVSKVPDIGVILSIKKDSVIYANGYRFIEENVVNSFSPRNVNESQFSKNLEAFNKSKLTLYSCNSFFPGNLKLVGPNVNERAGICGYCIQQV